MVESIDETIRKIKELKVQGAKAVAIAGLKALRAYTDKNGFGKGFEKEIKKLEEARPTAVVLHNCLETLKKERKKETYTKLLNQLRDSTNRLASKGQTIIKDGYKIMTHCHSSEVVALMKKAKAEGKKFEVYVTETRPIYQGLTAMRELAEAKIPVTYIVDSAAGPFMKDMDIVIVGTDALRKEGFVNKIGTYLFAIAAYHHKKPLYVVGSSLKLDNRKKIVIEERPPEEITHEKIKGVKVRNPAFDITPWKYVTRVVTDKGIMTPGNILRLLK